jgi:transposase
MRKKFNVKIYHRREIAESVMGSIKRKYGGSLRCRTARAQRAEVFCRLIIHNLIFAITRLFQQSRKKYVKFKNIPTLPF